MARGHRVGPGSFPRSSPGWSSSVGTVALYLPGYDVHDNGCLRGCTPSVAVHHPVTVARFFFSLIGNVIPGGILYFSPIRNFDRFEVVGVVLFAVAIFIVIQSWRHRADEEQVPLPLLLIGFSLTFDVTIALGRGGTGPLGAVSTNRYVMPNLILLTAIVMYAWKHRPCAPLTESDHGPSVGIRRVGRLLGGPGEGSDRLRSGQRRAWSMPPGVRAPGSSSTRTGSPRRSDACLQGQVLFFQAGALPSFTTKLRAAEQDRLGEFEPVPYRYYRRQGPPQVLFGGCATPSSARSPASART